MLFPKFMLSKSEIFNLLPQSSIKQLYSDQILFFFNLKYIVSFWFQEERYKSQRPLSTSYGPKFPLSNVKLKLKESKLNRLPQGMQSQACSPYSTRRFFQDQPAGMNLGNNFKISGESKPPFVVRHVSLRLFLRVLWNSEDVNEWNIVRLDQQNKWVILNREFKFNNNYDCIMFTTQSHCQENPIKISHTEDLLSKCQLSLFLIFENY